MSTDQTTERTQGLLVLDAAYSLDTVRRLGIEHSILCRDLGGYFPCVWSVNPLVGADPGSNGVVFGAPRTTNLAPTHSFIEGFIGLTPSLARLLPLNFLLAQVLVFWQLARLVRSGRVAAIRAGDPYYLGLMGLALKRLGRVPLLIRINGNYDAVCERTGRPAFPRLFRFRRIEKVIEHFVLRRASFVTAANQENLQFAIANGADPSRTAVFPYGNLIDPAHFTLPGERGPRPSDAPEGPFCAAVTRLEELKRVEDLLLAFASAKASHPHLRLLLVGEGSERNALRARAAALGLSADVLLPGERDQGWIARTLPHASVLLAASAGRALVEAALSARPIAAYSDDWHGELVQDGATGRLVPVGDVPALAQAISDLLAQPALAARLGAGAREAALRLMDPQQLDAKERAVYETLVP